MFVSSTELQNNFGKYLELCKREQVIVTRNGKKRALLMHWPKDVQGYEVDEPIPAYNADNTAPADCSVQRPPGWVSYREFLELTENSDQRYELIDGKVYMLAAPVYRHQAALGELHLLTREFLQNTDSCTQVFAPFDVRLIREPIRQQRETDQDDLNIVQPDLIVMCDYRKDLNEKDEYWGVPELAVEILSPSSRSKDSIKKVDLYMESGIEECWIVDPENRTVTIHVFRDFALAETRIALDGRPAESARFPGLVVEVERVLGPYTK